MSAEEFGRRDSAPTRLVFPTLKSKSHLWRLTFVKGYKNNIRGTSVDKSAFSTILEVRLCNCAKQIWSGRRESNPYYQLGKVNTALFIFNTYKTAQEKYARMRCIPCMHCLICVSLRDVLRDDARTKFRSLRSRFR